MADETVIESNAPAAPESSVTPPPVTTPAPSVPAAGASTAPSEPAKPESRRDTITRALADKKAQDGDTALRDRLIAEGKIKPASPAKQQAAAQMLRDKGKFVGKAPEQAAAAGAPEAPAAASVPLPKWLKKELEGEWGKAPQTLQQAFVKYGEDASKGIEKYKTEAATASAFMRDLQPFEQMVRAEGGTMQTAVKNMLQIASQLRAGSPQEKAQLVARTMQQYGVPFEHIAQMFGVKLTDASGQPVNVNIPQQDPQLAALMREVQTLKGSIQSQQQATQQAEDARVAQALDAFAKDHPHYEQLKPQIARIINGGLVPDFETKSYSEILQEAHDMALRLTPDLYEQHLAQERERAAQAEREKANQAAALSRQAAVQVKGAPGGKSLPTVDPKDRRTAIRHAIALHSRT